MFAVLVLALALPQGVAFAEGVPAFLERHCLECHSGAEPKGEAPLDVLLAAGEAGEDGGLWRAVRERVAAGEMPPAKRPQPEAEEVRQLLAWIDGRFEARVRAPVERPTLRRLTRAEYGNTIRDLLGIDFAVRERFPPDEVAGDFDNQAAALSLSPLQLERYLEAAEEIAALAILDEGGPVPRSRLEAGQLTGGSHAGEAPFRNLTSNGQIIGTFRLPREGEYALRVRACGTQVGNEPARMAVLAGRRELTRFDVSATRRAPQVYELRTRLPGGELRLAAAFLNDFWNPKDPDPKERDRNLHVSWLEVEGPLDEPGFGSYQRRHLSRLREADLVPAVKALAERAWRRPVEAREVEALLALSAEEELAPLGRARRALEAILVSPRFLFRLELDPPGAEAVGTRPLDAWELAARLSYFLWASLPDDALRERARSGELLGSAGLVAELERMLDDPRASSLARDFAPQWLQLRALERAAPDPARFPHFDDALRASMQAETELYFDAVLRERRSLWELLQSDFTFADRRLAELYGLPGAHGSALQRVRVEGGGRGGLLGQAGVLLVTSNPTRTSPVKRGKWILEVLLDAPPPPPPPGVGNLDEREVQSAASLREQLALHRLDANCAVCHDRLDPLGFGLEGFDAIGGLRARENGLRVDTSGTLPDGRSFDGPEELAALLVGDPAFLRGLAKKLMTYALGRALDADEERLCAQIAAELPRERPTFHNLLRAIVLSEPFRSARTSLR